MDPHVETPPAPAPSRRAWILAGATAAVVFLVFEAVGDFIAVPLREVSSALAQALLSVIGFPVTRHGTILSTPNATFDVVPACSGSTTLQVLLFFAILWCGIHPRLAPGRRVLAALLALPLAVLANALRVSALVAVGHSIGREPGDLVHYGFGIVAFALALLGLYFLTRGLASHARPGPADDRKLAWLLGALAAFLSLPFLGWCLEHWGGTALDRHGYLFFAPAVVLAAWRWRSSPADRTWESTGTVGLGLSLAALAAATLVDVNILKGLSLALAFLSLSMAFKGPRFAGSMIPVAMLAYLAFPSVSYQLGVLTAWKFRSLAAFLGMKAALGLPLALVSVLPFLRKPGLPGTAGPPRRLPVQVLMAALLAAFQTYYYVVASTSPVDMKVEMSYLQGAWVGVDRDPPEEEAEYFGRNRIWSRRFTRGGEFVDVLVSSTGGDRHRAHPPAYCLTGTGWVTDSEEFAEPRLGDGTRVPMTVLRMHHGDQRMKFCYWFTDGTRSHAGFSGMLLHDTLRRLGGRRADWLVFRVMTTSGDRALADFLSAFTTRLTPREAFPAVR